MNSTKCYACGSTTARMYLRPFGRTVDGRVKSWVCDDCDRGHALTKSSPSAPRIVGKAPIKFTTVLRAERLVAAGHGWTADEVLRNALDLLEQAGVRGERGVR